MSHRPGDDVFDAQLDRALRAIVADEDRPADLHAQVMASIAAGGQSRRRRRLATVLGFDMRLRARPAIAVAVAVLVAVLGVALWRSADRRGAGSRVPQQTRTVPAPRSAPLGNGERTATTTSPALPDAARESGGGENEQAPRRLARGRRFTPLRLAEPWDAAVPPLDPPEPLRVDPIEEPPLRVAQLEVEQLSVAPLETRELNRPGKE